jgi:retron-type reverse transcriptase
MKRAGNLYPAICSWENIERAAARARKRKRFKPYADQFEIKRETRLAVIRQRLIERTWMPGEYTTFMIHDPKERLICAPRYPDRIVHHALCNQIGPLVERTLIDHTYSCRVGKGTRAARERCLMLVKRYSHVLKLDVRRYFPSIDHLILKGKISRLIKCKATLDLIGRIIDSWQDVEGAPVWRAGDDLLTPAHRRKGVPIGALTSQLFANLYLSALDHHVQENLGVAGYIRYTDDLLLFSNDKHRLRAALQELYELLRNERLTPHSRKCRIHVCREGIPFLGFRFWPDRVRVLRANKRRFERRMARMQRKVKEDRCSLKDVWPSMFGWYQFVREYPVNEGLVCHESQRYSF